MQRHSTRGNPPTPTECELVASIDTGRVSDAMGQWVLIAQRVGLQAVLVVLDELGGESQRIPTRQGFLGALHRPSRNQAIRAARAAGVAVSAIAAEYGMTRQMVAHILANGARDVDAPRVLKAAR